MTKIFRQESLKVNNLLDPKKSKEGKLNLASVALHPNFQVYLAEVAEMSIEKGYEPLNWLEDESSVTVMYCLNAAMRHLNTALLGIDINTEEKTLKGEACIHKPMHLAQAAYNCLMACVILNQTCGKDDRVLLGGGLK